MSSDRESPRNQGNLACERCKRRKIKCDRLLPSCHKCLHISAACTYPLLANKPGPKPGGIHRRSRHAYRVSNTPQNSGRPERLRGEPPSGQDDLANRQLGDDVSNFDSDGTGSRGLSLSQLVHPSHDPPLNNGSPTTNRRSISTHDTRSVVENACHGLGISLQMCNSLIDAYFDHMTAFSLFHRPTFQTTLNSIPNEIEAQALLASMFSFSARFVDIPSQDGHDLNSPRHTRFHEVAEKLTEEALKQCADEVPSISLLQALILTTFHALIKGVRGRAWRSVGECVRIAYEMHLHLIDRTSTKSNQPKSGPSIDEEKRRAWWAIWEFDVFASTIRRLPTSIQWSQNQTWLPIEDQIWFSNRESESCALDPDPTRAWKSLQQTGNQSSKAWFIVLNALMRHAHLSSYPQAYSQRHSMTSADADLISNSLYCLSAALPQKLTYQSELLAFDPKDPRQFQLEGAKHSIHIMTQLSRFMINHQRVFESTSRQVDLSNNANLVQVKPPDQAAWTHYTAASDQIVSLVRNCAPRHIQYVNPFLASTIWLAAAAQIVAKDFGPSSSNIRISNLDVLQSNLDSFVSFWGVSESLKQKLSTLEYKLKSLKNHDRGRDLLSSIVTHRQIAIPEVHSEFRPETTSNDYSSNNANPYLSRALPTLQPGIDNAFASSWQVPQDFDMQNIPFNNEGGLNLWGWGIDELLMYGGAE